MKKITRILFASLFTFGLSLTIAAPTGESILPTRTVNANDASNAELPESFDLRHVGGTVSCDSEKKQSVISGGLSYVTPVKFQNPWGTCWAFGIVAAAEISILSELNLGTTDVNNTNLDLSEHHLAWFAKNHIPSADEEDYQTNYVSEQDGEGMWHLKNEDTMSGGMPYYGTSVFAAGMGVVTEEIAPYKGKNGNIIVRRNATASLTDYPNKSLYYDSIDAWNAETDQSLKDNYTPLCYSDKDDWSLNETDRFRQSYPLEESRVLPDAAGIQNKDGSIFLNESGIAAVKSELSAGRGVEVAFFADSSDPKQDASTNTARYINTNFAHYTWDKTSANHSVCIVGWDDNYSASNFGQDHPGKYDAKNRVVYKLKDSDVILEYSQNGKTLVNGNQTYELNSDLIEPAREEDGSMTVPAGNGAWIVKNSWGAKDNDFPNKLDWGSEGSGYFYLSYYDTSISHLETYDFVTTEDEKEEQKNYSIIDEYDFMPAAGTSQSVFKSPVMMANVFTAEEDMEIQAVSCETTIPGTVVGYYIDILPDGQEAPKETDKITKVCEPQVYYYSGYHREALKQKVTVKKGQKYAVLVLENYQELDKDGNLNSYYFVCSNKSYSAASGAEDYCVGIVNPGESYLLWLDEEDDENFTYDYYYQVTVMEKMNPIYTYDNFSIKAYAKPVTLPDDTPTPDDPTSSSTPTSSDISSSEISISSVISSTTSSNSSTTTPDSSTKGDSSVVWMSVAIVLVVLLVGCGVTIVILSKKVKK